MTKIDEVPEMLLETLPGLRREWELYKGSELYEPGEPYNDMGRLARFVVEGLARSQTSGFDQLFGVIEELLHEVRTDIREVVVVGFLEDLQNLSLNAGVPLENWSRWLQPSTRQAWQLLIGMWDGKTTQEEFNEYITLGHTPGGGQEDVDSPS